MTAAQSSISSERKGYGRGLILGLTMAETFLLLVFCLLLVAAAALASERKATDDVKAALSSLQNDLETAQRAIAAANTERQLLETKLRQLVEANARLEQTLASLPPEIVAANGIDDDWQELTLAKDLATAVQAVGLTHPEAMKLVSSLKVLKERGYIDNNAPEVLLAAALAKGDEETRPHEWPPIINLSEAGGYYFAVGSAELTSEFRRQLSEDVITRIASYLAEYQVDIVEVIGHTDEQNLAEGRTSNLDREVAGVLVGQTAATGLRPADNAGLGLARSIAVTQLLKNDPRLASATVLPLSGAQLIVPGDHLSDGAQAGDVRERRRIEIRIRRRSDQVSGTSQ
ncbi:MAG: OmpA family protein [Aquamicrobium sp.]|uniref:hypothetical protein n=1 Tax=Aquamicrobium sp. TaxID=1872579 RepID=UPI00349E9975|nr:OmpA family protein [Aquamicrobium sp.]